MEAPLIPADLHRENLLALVPSLIVVLAALHFTSIKAPHALPASSSLVTLGPAGYPFPFFSEKIGRSPYSFGSRLFLVSSQGFSHY